MGYKETKELSNKVTIAADYIRKKNYESKNILKTNSWTKVNWYLSVDMLTYISCAIYHQANSIIYSHLFELW